MIDLGTLGGAVGLVNALNNRDQVIGLVDIAGDATDQPLLWDQEVLTDPGTFRGENEVANWRNDAGEVVGKADLPGSQGSRVSPEEWRDDRFGGRGR
jgi:hypothetical protein